MTSRRKKASIGHHPAGVILDTNLLLLAVVGAADPSLISKFKRTREYSLSDFEAVMSFVADCERIIVTPNIATETSNWIGQLNGLAFQAVWECFCKLLLNASEVFVKSAETCVQEEAARLRVADCATILAAQNGNWVLTDDGPLHAVLLSRNLHAVLLRQIVH